MEAAHAMRPIDRLIKVISNTFSKMENYIFQVALAHWMGTRSLSATLDHALPLGIFNLCKCLFSILSIRTYSLRRVDDDVVHQMYAFYFRRRQTDDSPMACSFRKQKPVYRLTRVARTSFAICNEWRRVWRPLDWCVRASERQQKHRDTFFASIESG